MRICALRRSCATSRRVTTQRPGQIAISWLLHKGPDIVPIPGTKHVRYLEENLGASKVHLSADDMATLDASLTPDKISGPRYNERQAAHDQPVGPVQRRFLSMIAIAMSANARMRMR